jgi:hypothetical protein
MSYKHVLLLLLIVAAAFPSSAAADARGVDPDEPNPHPGLTF